MAEKVVSVRLRANVEGFTAGMAKARKSVDDLTKADVPKATKGYKDLANGAALAGAAIAVGLGVAVKRFAEFDKAMSAVKANSGATGAELESLRAAAIKLGADSQFSAKEAAEGVNELAKAGVRSADILNGGLKGALDLAAAGQIEVAQAAETTASALTQFGLSGDSAVHVADLLASGANKAQGGVGDLGQALGQAGLVAAATGLSIEETTAGLTAFASAGLIGSDAGTSFKTMLQRLTPQSDAASAAMEEVGLNAYDAQGNFIGLEAVAGQLKTGMKDLSQEQRNAAMTTIFGSDAVRASNILYSEGAEGIAKWTKEVNDQGAAARQAATLTDNLSGDIERLGGAFDSVLIQTGSGANESLRGLVQGLQGLVETVGKVPGPVLLAGAGLAAIALTVPKGLLALKNYRATLDSVGLSMDKIAAKGPRAAKGVNAVTGATKALGAAAAALVAAGAINAVLGGDNTRTGTEVLVKDLSTAGDSVAAFDKRLDEFATKSSTVFGTDGIHSFSDALDGLFNQGWGDKVDHAVGVIAGMVPGLNDVSRVTRSAEAFKDLDGTLASMVSSGNARGAESLFRQFANAAADQGVSIDQLKAKLPGYANALAGVDNAQASTATTSSKLAVATEEVQVTAEDAKKALDALRDAIDGLGSPLVAQRAAERDFQAAIDDTAARLTKRAELQKQLKEAEAEPTKTAADRKSKAADIARITEELANYSKGFDVNTEAGRANQAALDNIQKTTLEKVNADFLAAGGMDNLSAATKAGETAMQKGRDAFIAAATAAGLTKDAAKKLADQLGLIPTNVSIAVSQTGAAKAATDIDLAARDRTAIITVQTRHADFKAGQENAANAGPSPSGANIPRQLRKAQGGAIYGAGTGTSDSIHALLSNGEHVWTAAEVSKLGGQSAMYALRNAVRNGNVPRFATGGAVQYAPAVAYAGPTSHSTTNDSRLVADVVNIVTNDANSFKREIRTAPYRAKARPGR